MCARACMCWGRECPRSWHNNRLASLQTRSDAHKLTAGPTYCRPPYACPGRAQAERPHVRSRGEWPARSGGKWSLARAFWSRASSRASSTRSKAVSWFKKIRLIQTMFLESRNGFFWVQARCSNSGKFTALSFYRRTVTSCHLPGAITGPSQTEFSLEILSEVGRRCRKEGVLEIRRSSCARRCVPRQAV